MSSTNRVGFMPRMRTAASMAVEAAEEEARKVAEAEAKTKEAEEKDRQERFRRARQLSFERKAAKKKRLARRPWASPAPPPDPPRRYA
jgi:hypothetical protein